MGTRRRYRGYVARGLLDQHTYQGRPENVDQLLELTKVKASTLAERMKNKQIPLKFEHKDEIVSVGKVVNAAVMKDADGSENLVAEFEVDEHGPAGIVVDSLDKFALNGLSLTHLSESLEPLELSIVAKGARPGTIITGRPGFKEWLQSKGPDAAVSASIQQWNSEALNALVYKTLFTTDCCIRASDNNIMSFSLVRQPEAETKHVVNLAGASDLDKIMQSVLPPAGAHPFSNPDAERAKLLQAQKDQQLQQLQQQFAFMMQQMQQLQQPPQPRAPAEPPMQQQPVQASTSTSTSAPAAPAAQQQPPAANQQQPAPMQVDQQQQQPEMSDLFKAAAAIVNPTKGLMTDEEKAMSVRAIRESHEQLQKHKAEISAARQELELMKKAKAEADKQTEDAKKQAAEMRTTAVQMLSAVPADPEVVAEMKRAAERNDDTALRQSMMNAAIAASKNQAAMQQQLVHFQQLQQQQAEQQKQQAAMQELQMFRNSLNNSTSFGNNFSYSPPIQASAATLQTIPSQAPAINNLNADYFNDQMIRASTNIYMKQNNGNLNGGLSSDESWKAKPYKPGSIVDRVLRDDSPQYMGRNTLERFDIRDIESEAQKIKALMQGGNFNLPSFY